MTNNRSVLLISAIALILLALVPAVSAAEYNFELDDTSYKEQTSIPNAGYLGNLQISPEVNSLWIINANEVYGNELVAIYSSAKREAVANYNALPQFAATSVTIGDFMTGVFGYYKYQSESIDYLECYLIQIEYINDYPTGLTGRQRFLMVPDDSNFIFPKTKGRHYASLTGDYNLQFAFGTDYEECPFDDEFKYYNIFRHNWKQNLIINTSDYHDSIELIRNGLPSTIYIETPDLSFTNNPNDNSDYLVYLDALNDRPYLISVKNPLTNKYFNYTVNLDGLIGEPGEPGEPGDVMLRTGTVTMTDHNGTTISGFEVKAVNYYTGEEYTTSTQSDVATITLPMDRTISWRNPQTGQYEDVPVGYYTFFVSKPGYKMTSEDGVRISVMPEQYSSYHFGDIIVTSEDGYLTGKHQFQIRSRADLSILQTGTISAQSATTGEWFNTTVTDGIATLILPYDTSDSISPYVGNYYVYATSPGYIPSEYATQISVRPDTQSEIRSILLTPIGGIPEAGNVTLRIQAVSDSGQGIPNAEIHIDGVDGAGWEVWESYTASATGYAEISVPENSSYDITVYGEGYYSSSQRIEVGDTDPPLMEFKLYPTGAPTLTPTPQPTGWVTPPPTTQPPPGIPDEDDKSEGFLMEAIRGISKAFGVGFATGKTIFGMLLALAIGFATAKQLRGGAAEFGLGLLGGTMLGVLIGLLPVWVVVVLLLVVGMYIGYRYVGGSNNG